MRHLRPRHRAHLALAEPQLVVAKVLDLRQVPYLIHEVGLHGGVGGVGVEESIREAADVLDLGQIIYLVCPKWACGCGGEAK